MTCEKCWGDAYMRMLSGFGSQPDCYRQLLEERKDNPCTPEQQRGKFGENEEEPPVMEKRGVVDVPKVGE